MTTSISGSTAFPAASPTTRPLAAKSGADMSRAAHDFEAMAIGEFLQPMFSTEHSGEGMFGGGEAESTLKPMLVTEFARIMEQKGGLGLAGPVERKMAELENAKEQSR